MARLTAILALLFCVASVRAEDPVSLREVASTGTSRVLIELKAEGVIPVETPKGTTTKEKPLPFKIEARLDFFERIVKKDADESPRRAARRAVEAVAAVGDIRGLSKLRPDVALLLADRRDSGVVVLSPSGPLMRSELDLVQIPGDPLALLGLLPDKPVKIGDKWTVSDLAAMSLCDYDRLDKNGLEAKLDSLDNDSAVIRLGGEVKGAARGGEGTIRFVGKLTFDRKLKQIKAMQVDRDETRKAGPVESALAVKSTLTVSREAAETPAALSDEVLATLPAEIDPRREWLLLSPPGARYALEHDRDWHLKREEEKAVVLTRLDGKTGVSLAHLHLSTGPKAGKGRHQNLEAFRDDVRKAIGPRFDSVVRGEEFDDGPEGGFQYKLTILGHEGDRPVLWYYYLLAGPEGDQLLGIFTLDPDSEKKFDAADRAILMTLEWKAP